MPILTAEERVGTVLGGRYSLESILGTGGTAVVYRATHTFTQRQVALKILKHEHARNRELVSRFLREARVASTLSHPNVVAILDMGTEDGDTYLAMELLHGEPLSNVLNTEGPLSVERTLGLLRPVMEAVALAHTRGVVHRDLKPDNILVGDRGDGQTRAILLDFGMAKTQEAAWGHMTQSGILVGTPFYMSPEQAEGAHDIDAGTDVWAMGVTLYRCFTGTLPFFTTSPSALLLAIARGEHVPVGERAPSLPKPIAAWVERALLNDRTRRYRDMSEMLAALDRALQGEMVHAAPVVELTPPAGQALPSQPSLEAPSIDAGSLAGAPASRRGAMIAVAVAVVVALLAIVAALRSGSTSAPPTETPATAAPPSTTALLSPPTTPPATTATAADTPPPPEAPVVEARDPEARDPQTPEQTPSAEPARPHVRRPRPPRGGEGTASDPSDGRSHSGLASEW